MKLCVLMVFAAAAAFADQAEIAKWDPNMAQKNAVVRKLYEKLVAEGWKDLVYLPKEGMYAGDYEGTVDGCHPNDLGMQSMKNAFGKAVREALELK